ncbi:cation-translocating P-type ATPase [uncultured Campylobacter sp.]|uniref:heavy metal translocating P-type ATPase n=1 Tax=uncultured Campylobacter sp. TaxID=218934 RepID=UPI00261C3CAC|nr:cation-translocating P-type ATPase [uncultured Campylobacter sp.]
MSQIKVVSRTKGRVRLKSPLFKKIYEKEVAKILDDENCQLRFNYSCSSLILRFKEDNINLYDIAIKLYTLMAKLLPPTTKENEACCEFCPCECSDAKKKNFGLRIVEFGFMSAVWVAVFIKEHILLTAFSPLSLVALSALSLYFGREMFKKSIKNIQNKRFNLENFVSISLLIALVAGEVATAFEIVYVLKASTLFEEIAADRSKKEIAHLIKLNNKKAYILDGDLEVEVDVSDIKKDDILVVRSLEQIVADGTIVDGKAEIDESIINGRSSPTLKSIGDMVYANSIVDRGRIYIKVAATGDETYISRVMSEVEKHLKQKSPSEQNAQKLAKRVLKIGSIATFLTYLFTLSPARAFGVMVVMSCPCSTVLAASSAVSKGIAEGAKEGVLIKGGEYLENFKRAEVVCFDKTGTLTTSTPLIKEYKTTLKDDQFFAILAGLETRNTHPLAVSILNYAKNRDITPLNMETTIHPGLGISSKFNRATYLFGNRVFMEQNEINLRDFAANDYLDRGYSVSYLAKVTKSKKEALGVVGFENEERAGIEQMLSKLRSQGVKKLVVLSGDEEVVANNFAKKFGFDEYYANLLPDQKAKIIDNLKKNYSVVAMIGDGVNDTLAMSRADISVSFASGGSTAAIKVSNIAITDSDPRKITTLYELSKKVNSTVEQNYKIGIATNILGAALSAVGIIGPAGAGLVHIGHTVAILGNSSRIKFINKDEI